MSHSKADPSDTGSFAGAMFTSDRLNELHIKDHVPIILDLDSPSYNAWRTYFVLLFRSYRLIEHVDGSVDFRDMKDDDKWLPWTPASSSGSSSPSLQVSSTW